MSSAKLSKVSVGSISNSGELEEEAGIGWEDGGTMEGVC